MSYKFIPYSTIESYIKEMEKQKVSEVARSPTGFLAQYKKYGKYLPDEWATKRNNFIKRHLAAMVKNKESLFDKEGNPTRRHLALIAWAYDPQKS